MKAGLKSYSFNNIMPYLSAIVVNPMHRKSVDFTILISLFKICLIGINFAHLYHLDLHHLIGNLISL